ncbi:hypothetical protein [Massilia antarctica]|uniref:hypothetical protein n=1 Tax=Massilia antarctica TaxID=2765360 RepID=UPI0011AFC45D|nr:hypothetical protein [Massilia sp. H27-R4]MCY0911389.1 hypothetical protein [Massilia sp. H27-R4]
MDVKKLIARGEFFYADCIAINSSQIVGYEIKNHKIEIDHQIPVDISDLTDIFPNFSVEMGESTYVGGEAASHGSCGFFYKKTQDVLNWALISTESNPFINVEVHQESIRFLTSSGFTWIVPGDNIKAVYIERSI